jgi:type IV pilus assembly protein PilN
MAKINLLPWRAERRKQRQTEFVALLGICALAAVLVVFGVMQYFDSVIANQQQRNALLQREIKALEAKITQIEDLEKTKSRLVSRKEVIEQLQASRSQMVHLFDDLVRTIPEGVRLGSIKQAGDKLTLEGLTQSSARVSAYMRNIEASGWMTKPDLSLIEAKGPDKIMPYIFKLEVTVASPASDEDQSNDGVEATP